MPKYLSSGSQVCIIGGGPAGSLAALHLLALAKRQNLGLNVFIFEPRDFTRPGPGGCNRCAGILSSRLLRGLTTLGIHLPREVIQAEINSYALFIDGDRLLIAPPSPKHRIVSIYRGGGPRLFRGERPPASFDGFLLGQAEAAGATRIPNRVHKVSWDGRPVAHIVHDKYPADLLVLATGINSRPPLDPDFGYRAPQTAVMAQDEILRPAAWPADQVRAFFQTPPGLTFGALIPKGDYLNISLLGKGFTRDTIDDFIELQGLKEKLTFQPGESNLCGCTPRIAVGAAGHYYGDRWVAVGDAAVTRLYKDGIGSAFYTAQAAMTTAVTRGISRRHFQHTYAPATRRIHRDNQYGRLLFRLWQFTLRRPTLLHAWVNAIRLEKDYPASKHLHTRILWGMFTGDEWYRDIFRLSISPAASISLLRGWQAAHRKRKA